MPTIPAITIEGIDAGDEYSAFCTPHGCKRAVSDVAGLKVSTPDGDVVYPWPVVLAEYKACLQRAAGAQKKEP